MTTRAHFITPYGLRLPGYVNVCYAPDDGTGNTDPDPKDQEPGKNNDDITSLWLDNEDGGKPPQQDPQNPPKQNDTQQQQPNPQDIFDNYAKGLQFPGLNLSPEEQQAVFEEQNLSVLDQHFQNTMRQFASGFLSDITKIVKTSQDQAIAQAVEKAQTNSQSDEIVSMLKGKYEYAKDPIVGPIAESALARLINKGAAPEAAINGVDRAMKYMFETLSSHYGSPQQTLGEPPANSAGSTPFGTNAANEPRKFDDWAAFLRNDVPK